MYHANVCFQFSFISFKDKINATEKMKNKTEMNYKINNLTKNVSTMLSSFCNK